MSSNVNPRRRVMRGLQKVLDRGQSREEALDSILKDLPARYCAKWTSLFYGCLRSYNYLMPWLEEIRKKAVNQRSYPERSNSY